jgi:Zn-dependent metalloprotease
LPGTTVSNPPTWNPNAVSAHANAEEVVKFLKTTLGRNGLDNRGSKLISSINCVVASDSPGPKEWINAAWIGTQMVYGQRRNGAGLMSLSANLDVVAHEIFHGVTDFTARLEYQAESGALNESYSDIFGILISNFSKTDVTTWDWELGEGLTAGGTPFRDLKDPTRFGQPKHMRDFVNTRRDNGGVHTNSGIHNFAAFRIMSAQTAAGSAILTPKESAAIFYLALSQRLSRTSGFSDSRRAVVASARTLFRGLTSSQQTAKISAIEKGFTAAGIS